MSAHPILDELAIFINEQFSMTTGRNRRNWVKAAAILKRHTDELDAKDRALEQLERAAQENRRHDIAIIHTHRGLT
jgi:predicted NAD/FAD-binding protein